MRVIYIAGAYRGECENDVFENIVHARREAVKLWDKGFAVICPHTNSFFMGSRLGDTHFLEGDLEIVRRCDAMYLLAGWAESEGAQAEFRLAHELGLEILFEES
uniref:DUF4406 domain-containing protein n=1 Tax=viral metagenome TaxID=1070528 RepID=A0A6M3KYH8_9ZZZZ